MCYNRDMATIKWKLPQLMADLGVNPFQLSRESKVSYQSIYPISQPDKGPPTAIRLETLGKIIKALRTLTGKEITERDILEFIED